MSAIWLIWLSPGGMDRVLKEEEASPEFTWPEDLTRKKKKKKRLNWRAMREKGSRGREQTRAQLT